MLTNRAMRTLRSVAERSMVDEIEVWRGSDSEFGDDLVESHVEGEMVLESKARIMPTSGPREQAVGEGVIAMRDADVIIPVDTPLPSRDDEVYVKSSADPAMEGRWLRITDVRAFSQQAARRFSVVMAQPSRQWRKSQEEDESDG